jgi:tripartite ATP-independent transporter DctP family solute receptor
MSERLSIAKLFLLLACSAFVLILPRGSDAAEFTFVHSSLNPQNHVDYKANMDFVERIDFKIYHSAVLGDENEMMEQIQSGAITTARLSPSPLGALCDGYMIFNLPFLFSSPEHMIRATKSEKFDALTEKTLLKEGIRPLAHWWMGKRDLYTKKPVTKMGDLQGMKLRVWEDKYVVNTWKRLGAIPTPISLSELYTALQTGTVDGAEGWAATYNSRSYFEIAPYLTKLGYINIASTLVISDKVWKKLPVDLQRVVTQAAAENSDFTFKYFKDIEASIYDTSKKKGANILEVNDIEKWRQATLPVFDEFGKQHGKQYADFIQWILAAK